MVKEEENTTVPVSEKFARSSELFKRVFSSVFIVVAIIGSITLGGWAWALVASAVALVSMFEFYNLIKTQYHVSMGAGLVFGFLTLACASFYNVSAMLAVIAIGAFFVLFIEVMKRQMTEVSGAIFNAGGTLFGLCYIALPWSFLIIMREQVWGYLFLYALFLSTWSCDVFAYFVGSRWGKRPLCSSVSPKKTWEGFFGGVLGSALASSALALAFSFPPLPLLILGLLCGTAGQLGDLAESILKREAGIKDTGSIIPGHGGMLDRFDSILINAALAFLIFEVMVR